MASSARSLGRDLDICALGNGIELGIGHRVFRDAAAPVAARERQCFALPLADLERGACRQIDTERELHQQDRLLGVGRHPHGNGKDPLSRLSEEERLASATLEPWPRLSSSRSSLAAAATAALPPRPELRLRGAPSAAASAPCSAAEAQKIKAASPLDRELARGHFGAKTHGTSPLKFRGECALPWGLSTEEPGVERPRLAPPVSCIYRSGCPLDQPEHYRGEIS